MLEAEFKQVVNMVNTTDLKEGGTLFWAQQVNLEILMLSRNTCILYEINFWPISNLFCYISKLIGI